MSEIILQLKDIVKDYAVAGDAVHALKEMNLSFRRNEFVSVLGPSGCGKTTLLNIIGGLDRYTSGDLVIKGVSTKEFRDGDWDAYRNESIGFVFQSYNLISHQTVLENVALALTLSGVGREERIRRAKEALDKVGLKDHYNKKPNQLSGGQCQRVAIARALVNNPEILLADEPTGALDSETSVQIMEFIKEISHDRLVIMVTHNPELAYQYSTRIVELKDGELCGDSNPPEGIPRAAEQAEKQKAKSKGKKTHDRHVVRLGVCFERQKSAHQKGAHGGHVVCWQHRHHKRLPRAGVFKRFFGLHNADGRRYAVLLSAITDLSRANNIPSFTTESAKICRRTKTRECRLKLPLCCASKMTSLMAAFRAGSISRNSSSSNT